MLGTIAASQGLMVAVVLRAALGVEASALLEPLVMPALVAMVAVFGPGLLVWGEGVRATAERGLNAVRVAAGRVSTPSVAAVALAFGAVAVLLGA